MHSAVCGLEEPRENKRKAKQEKNIEEKNTENIEGSDAKNRKDDSVEESYEEED